MHFVFLNQYYPPDAAPTGVMLSAVVEHLAAQGHQVTVICAAGGYAGLAAGGLRIAEDGLEIAGNAHPTSSPSIIRIGATRFGRGTFVGKLMDYLSYYLGVAWKLWVMRPRPERIVALTTPPYLSVLARAMSKARGADHAHWVMDLYPDVMVAHGMLVDRSWLHRLLAGMARWGFGGKRCAAVLTLGPDMAERVGNLRRPAGGDQVTGIKEVDWVPLWGEGELRDAVTPCHSLRHQRGWRDGELIVMYSGNMGLGHRFGEILEVAAGQKRKVGNPDAEVGNDSQVDALSRQDPANTRFVFFGGGKRRGEIEAFAREHPAAAVELHDYAPAEILTEHLQSADVHVASLDASWTGTMVPSKLQGIFAAGRPVIFIGSAASSIGRWVAESGGGWVVRPGDVAGLLEALDDARDPDQRAVRGAAAMAFAANHFDKAANVERVAAVLGR